MEERDKEIETLENKIRELEYGIRDVKQSYHAKFTALILAANTHDAVSSDWLKGAIDHLLKEDEDWWGHVVKGNFKEEVKS